MTVSLSAATASACVRVFCSAGSFFASLAVFEFSLILATFAVSCSFCRAFLFFSSERILSSFGSPWRSSLRRDRPSIRERSGNYIRVDYQKLEHCVRKVEKNLRRKEKRSVHFCRNNLHKNEIFYGNIAQFFIRRMKVAECIKNYPRIVFIDYLVIIY